MRRHLASTGVTQDAGNKYGAEPPEFAGRHLWCFVAMWSVTNPVATSHHFDLENLITMLGPACFWCEQPWQRTIGARCPGDPRKGVPNGS